MFTEKDIKPGVLIEYNKRVKSSLNRKTDLYLAVSCPKHSGVFDIMLIWTEDMPEYIGKLWKNGWSIDSMNNCKGSVTLH